MPTNEDVLLTFQGIDKVSQVASSIAQNTENSISSANQGVINSANSMGEAYNSTFNQIGNGLSTLNMGMRNISNVSGMLMRELGAYKSSMEYVYGTTSAEDTNKVLVQTWGDAKTSAQEIYDTVDAVTDKSLTSMQDLIPAMNAFKAATNATGTQLKESVAEDMAQFGAYVLALTGSEQLARTAMTDLSKGLVGKGSFNALDQYGVTKASLMSQGWSGKNEDIEGYMSAVRKVSGAVEDLMDTNAGLDAQLGKMWSRAGKRIGREMMPGLKSLKTTFMELDEEMDGNLSTSILRISLLIDETHQKIYQLNTLFDATKNLMSIGRGILNYLTDDTDLNTLAIQENTDAKLANADATMLMNDANMNSILSAPATVPIDGMGGGGLTESFLNSNIGSGIASEMWSERFYNKNQPEAPNNMPHNINEYIFRQLQDENKNVKNITFKEAETAFNLKSNELIDYKLAQQRFYREFANRDNMITHLISEYGYSKSDAETHVDNYIWGLLKNKKNEEKELDEVIRILNEYNHSKYLTSKNIKFDKIPPIDETILKEAEKADLFDNDVRRTSNIINYIGERGDDINRKYPMSQNLSIPDLGLLVGDLASTRGMSTDPTTVLAETTALNKRTTSQLKNTIETFDEVFDETKKLEKLDKIDDATIGVVNGPFQKIDGFWKTLQREWSTPRGEDIPTPDLGIERKLDNIWEGIARPFSKSSSRFSNAKTELKDAFDKLDWMDVDAIDDKKIRDKNTGFINKLKRIYHYEGFTGAEKADTLYDGLKKAFHGLTGKGKYADIVKNVEGTSTQLSLLNEIMDGTAVNMTKLGTSAGLAATETGIAGASTGVLATGMNVMGAETTALETGAGVVNVTAPVAGAEMEGASAGLSFMGLAEMGLAGAFKTLIIPTLAIAGVIAVMIPIVAGLAIEALFFINIVGQMIDAMDFGQFDLDGAVEGLQSLAEAFAWLGLALGGLSFAGLMSMISFTLAGALMIPGVLSFLVDTLLNIANEMQPLSGIYIDESIGENLMNLSSALGSMAVAMLALSALQLTSIFAGIVTGFGAFGTIADSINRAKNDIQTAIDAINDLNFNKIDESKVNQLKTSLEAIKTFAEAMGSITGMRTNMAVSDFTSWLLDGGFFGDGGRSISEAINEAKDDITEASKALSDFTNVSDIDQTTVDRLTKAGEGIKAMGDAFEGLRKIRDDKNWDAMFEDGGPLGFLQGKHDIASALEEAKDDIVEISFSLKGLDGKLADIPDNVGERLQKVADTLTAVSTAIDSLKKIKDSGGKKNKNFDAYVETIKTVREDLIKVSNELKGLGGDDKGKGGLADLSSTGIDDKIKAITTTLTNISESIEGLNTISTQTSKGQKFATFKEMIKTTRSSLVEISEELMKFEEGSGKGGKHVLVDIGGTSIDSKLKSIASTLANIAEAVNQLNTINAVVGDGSKMDTYATMIDKARDGLVKVSEHLKQLDEGGEGKSALADIPEGLSERIHKVTHTLAEIAMAFENLRNLYSDYGSKGEEGGEKGFQDYVDMIDDAKVALVEISGKLKELDDGGNGKALADIDEGLPAKIGKVTSTLSAVNTAMSEMQTMFSHFGGSGEQPGGKNKTIQNPLYNTNVQKGKGNEISNIEQYKKTVEESATALKSISTTLKNTLGGEKGLADMGDISHKINNVKSALTALKGSAGTMSKFPKIDGHTVGYNVGRAVTGLKRASTEMKKLNDGDKVGENITAIIDEIHGAVKKLKKALGDMNFQPEGKNIGANIKSGISTGLGNLTSTVSGKISGIGPAVAGTAQSLGTTLANSVKTGFETALDLVSIVSSQLQQAKLTADAGSLALMTGASSGMGVMSNNDVASEQDNSGQGGIMDFKGVTRRMINNLENSGYNSLNLNKFNQNKINSLDEINKESNMGKSTKNVQINIGEGAIQLDSRNMTLKESRQIMINALEGLGAVKEVRY